MILGGMGPVNELHSDGAKIFASIYALYSGLLVLALMGIVLSPVVHRVMHKFHVDEKDMIAQVVNLRMSQFIARSSNKYRVRSPRVSKGSALLTLALLDGRASDTALTNNGGSSCQNKTIWKPTRP